MIIPIVRGQSSLKEWVMIELQGDLKHSSGDLSNSRFIGDLHFTESGVPILIIGIHILYGKEIELPKPFAVIEKVAATMHSDESQNNVLSQNPDCEYTVKAIVRKKLIFKGRPKPIVTDVPMWV